MKPDWKDAPDWAKWVAQDRNGDWFWFECQPQINRLAWYAGRGDVQCAAVLRWKETLEARP